MKEEVNSILALEYTFYYTVDQPSILGLTILFIVRLLKSSLRV